MSHHYFFQMLYRVEDKREDETVVQRMAIAVEEPSRFGVEQVIGRVEERRWIEGPYLRHVSWLLSGGVRVKSAKRGAGGSASNLRVPHLDKRLSTNGQSLASTE